MGNEQLRRMMADNGFECAMYFQLDHDYVMAWTHGDHAKVVELRRAIEDHKRVCSICQGSAGLASLLWPNAHVEVVDGTSPSSVA